MDSVIKKEEIDWADKQVGEYGLIRPQYAELTEILRSILDQIAKRYDAKAVVETRTKDLVSFAEKIWRKKEESPDPVNQFTDLCGGRIIASNTDQVEAICGFIEQAFEIDKENSVSLSQRLKPTEFGYRSIHYIVQIDPEKLQKEGITDVPKGTLSDVVTPDLRPLKAEIQVRTVLSHFWSEFSHRIGYKQGYDTPEIWKRELSKLSAFLEEADHKLIHIQKGLGHYLRSYGAYMTPEMMKAEIEILTNVLKHDSENESIALEIARLANELREWDTVLTVLEPFKDGINPSILCTYGLAVCNKNDHAKTCPGSPVDYQAYRQGLRFIERALELRPNDVAIICALAGTYRDVDDAKAETLYRLAFTLDPTNPYPLSYYLDYVARGGYHTVTKEYLRPLLKQAYTKSRELADVNLDLPWSFFNMGKFALFMGEPYDALQKYIKGCQSSASSWPVMQALRSLKALRGFGQDLPGQGWIEKFLSLYIFVKFGEETQWDDYTSERNGRPELKEPVVIVSGGTDKSVAADVATYQQCLKTAFRDFTGTIVSGGTLSGICGIVGHCQKHYGDSFTSIGYLPARWRTEAGGPDASELNFTKPDRRYTQLRKSQGTDFSPVEPLLFWEDLITAGIPPANVKLIGTNGGRISAIEFRMALALGARVGIVKDSGRSASDLLADPDWNTEKELYPLPKDPETVREFVNQPITKEEFPECERLAEFFHDAYRKEAMKKEEEQKNQNFFVWRELPKELKDSNRQEAMHIRYKVGLLGYEMRRVEGREPTIVEFNDAEIRFLGKVEHGRWNVERLRKGWRWGPEKDIPKKVSPYIIPWDSLSDTVKGYDLKTVAEIPTNLAKLGIELVKVSPAIVLEEDTDIPEEKESA